MIYFNLILWGAVFHYLSTKDLHFHLPLILKFESVVVFDPNFSPEIKKRRRLV